MVSTFLILLVFKSYGQDYKFIYYLDENLNTVPKGKAVIIGKGYILGASMILDCFPKDNSRKVVSATFTDSSLSTMNGKYQSYYANMTIESEGNYSSNDMDGVWKYWDTTGLLSDSMIYRQGIRIGYGKYIYNFKEPTITQLLYYPGLKDTLSSYRYSFTDSIKNTFTEKEVSIINGKERLNFEANFIGERGLLKEYDSTGAVKTDSVFSRQLVEPSFPGGEDEWGNFLRKTLDAAVPAVNNAPDGKYTIIMRFIVNPDGRLGEIKAENDPGFGMVEEARRVLKMQKWLPAIRYGVYQRVYRRQPITFLIETSR